MGLPGGGGVPGRRGKSLFLKPRRGKNSLFMLLLYQRLCLYPSFCRPILESLQHCVYPAQGCFFAQYGKCISEAGAGWSLGGGYADKAE